MIKDRSRLCLILSGAIILIALIMTVAGFGMNAGIDFTGGTLFTYSMGQDFNVSDVEWALAKAGYSGTAQITKSGDAQQVAQIRVKDAANPDESRTLILFEPQLRDKYSGLEYISTETISAVAGRKLVYNALL